MISKVEQSSLAILKNWLYYDHYRFLVTMFQCFGTISNIAFFFLLLFFFFSLWSIWSTEIRIDHIIKDALHFNAQHHAITLISFQCYQRSGNHEINSKSLRFSLNFCYFSSRLVANSIRSARENLNSRIDLYISGNRFFILRLFLFHLRK